MTTKRPESQQFVTRFSAMCALLVGGFFIPTKEQWWMIGALVASRIGQALVWRWRSRW